MLLFEFRNYHPTLNSTAKHIHSISKRLKLNRINQSTEEQYKPMSNIKQNETLHSPTSLCA
jgi:hypothetical protein